MLLILNTLNLETRRGFASRRASRASHDEIDKADLEFQRLLWELDKMEFYITETKKPSRQFMTYRNYYLECRKGTDAFLRRCIFHYIEFPGRKDGRNREGTFRGC